MVTVVGMEAARIGHLHQRIVQLGRIDAGRKQAERRVEAEHCGREDKYDR